MTKKTIQIVGPYFTNYSYAKVNRNLAIAINKLSKDYSSPFSRKTKQLSKFNPEFIPFKN